MLLDYTRGLTAPPRPRRPPSAGAQQVRVDELARDAGTFEIGAEPGAAAIVEPFHPEGPPSPLQIGRAPGGDHAVVAVIVDHRLAVDVELAAVVRGEGAAVEAVLRDIDPPLEDHGDAVAAGKGEPGQAWLVGPAGRNRLKRGEVRKSDRSFRQQIDRIGQAAR